MFYEDKVWEFLEKINGIALKKAKYSEDTYQTYFKIFQEIPRINDPEDVSALQILGDLGG